MSEPASPSRSPEPRAASREPQSSSNRLDWILRAAFGIAATGRALAAVVMFILASPHGEWDAWAIWNQHARFLFRGGGSDAWRALLCDQVVAA